MIFCYSSFAYTGLIVSVEIDIRRGIPAIDIVGLPGSEIRESRERIRIAINNSGFHFPAQRIVINLAPAGIRKYGVAFDLAIAIAILRYTGQISFPTTDKLMVLGELCLDGSVRGVHSVLAAIMCARDHGIANILLAEDNIQEAKVLTDIQYASIDHLSDIKSIVFKSPPPGRPIDLDTSVRGQWMGPNFSDVFGQKKACRLMLIAATGRHNVLLSGPPGIGKTMLCNRVLSLQPGLNQEEAKEVTRIYSLIDRNAAKNGLIYNRNLRSPHHSASLEGMVGGGTTILPGEISLAHHGVLFLDEANEFRGRILQALREPMEIHHIHIVRAGKTYIFPADFQLLISTNVCPCGNFGSVHALCLCSQQDIFRYWRRIGAPLIDRIELRLRMQDNQKDDQAMGKVAFENMRTASLAAIARQEERYREHHYRWNARIPPSDIARYCIIKASHRKAVALLFQKIKLFGRSYNSVLHVARSIADLSQSEYIAEAHVQEALTYRREGELY